jgi:hypothetical protein
MTILTVIAANSRHSGNFNQAWLCFKQAALRPPNQLQR